MKYQKLDRHEKKEVKKESLKSSMSGEGLYIYENNSDADLKLPRPTKSGVLEVKARQRFQGDNYYMQMVQNGHLRFIEQLQSPEQQREALMQEQAQTQDKLILDQPETVTQQGTVEHVVVEQQPAQSINETDAEQETQKVDVLINESPVGDAFIICDD